ncbi:diguanylate cyclase, partial [Raoultella sp. Ech2A]|uniref:diguanylate cyclase n=1 Tax=Raoultella sp. Ech2A TaxID=2996539 RepID=UPI0024BFD913
LCTGGQVACRFGGEEFVVFLPDTGLTAAAEVAERIRVGIENADFPHAERVTISLGVAGFSDSENDVYSVLRRADLALYEAKRSGRNAVVIADAEGFSRI